MTSSTSRVNIPHTITPTSSSQAASQPSQSPINATIASVASATFATQNSNSMSFSNVLRSDTVLQTILKTTAEIDALVELGKTNGTHSISKDQITTHLKEKLQILKENAKDPSHLPSIRSDLCKLSKISSTHYHDLKEEIYQLLIQFIEKDPILPHTAAGILEMIIDLNSDLALTKAQLLTIPLQKKLARAFSAAVELYLRHYQMQDHVNAVMEDQKKQLLDTQNSFNGLNTKENVALEFATQMAIEANKRLTTDNSAFLEILQRLTHFVTAIGKAYDKDIAAFFSEFSQAFQGIENKIKEKWYEALFVIRDLIQKTPDTNKKIMLINTSLITKGMNYDWKFTYGCLEILSDIISQIQTPKVLDELLFGQPTPSNTIAASAMITTFPGVIKYLEFKEYSKKATIVTEKDTKADKAIQTKGEELCKLLKQKLAATYEGRKLLHNRYTTGVSNQNKILWDVIPRDPKQYAEWLGTPSQLLRPRTPPLVSGIITADLKKENNEKLYITYFRDFFQAIERGEKEFVQKQLSQNRELIRCNDDHHNLPLIIAVGAGQLEICKALLEFHASPFDTHSGTGYNALQLAIDKGYIEIVKLFSTNKTLLDALNNDETPLMVAVRKGNQEMVEILLRAGADPLTRNSERKNVLHLAVENGNIAMVKILSVNKQLIMSTWNRYEDDNSSDYYTPLHISASKGYKEVCNVLLEAGADPLATTGRGETTLHTAVISRKKDIVCFLSANKQLINIKDKAGRTPLLFASFLSLEICEVLMKAGADPLATTASGDTVLHTAVHHGQKDIVSFLLPNKQLVDLKNADGDTPFLYAAGKSLEICEVLLKAGADPLVTNASGETALHIAVRSGKKDIASFLSANKQLIELKNNEGKTPLLLAVELSLEIYEVLLKAGADPITTTTSGDTILHIAVRMFRTDIVSYFSSNKHLLDLKNNKNETPLLIAATTTVEIFEILLKAGANLLATDSFGNTVLHNTVPPEIALILLSNKQLINAKNNKKETPLMFAAKTGNAKLCKMLLEAGADPLAVEIKGNNVMLLAAEFGKEEVVRKLIQFASISDFRDPWNYPSFREDNVRAAANNRSSNNPKRLIYSQLIDTKNSEGYTPLLLAARKNHSHVCTTLLAAGADPLASGDSGKNIFHYAAFGWLEDATSLFEIYHQYINVKDNDQCTPLMMAASGDSRAACDTLLKLGADTLESDKEGYTPMHYAAMNGNPEIIIRLLLNKLYSQSANQNDSMPLLRAANSSLIELCEGLLKEGDGINLSDERSLKIVSEQTKVLQAYIQKELIEIKNKQGVTPLFLTYSRRVCEILLKAGADRFTDQGNGNVLHRAVILNKVDVIQLFSTDKQLINAKGIGGRTPLMIAAQLGNREICELLLKAGAEIHAMAKSGKTALQFAQEAGKDGVVQLLSGYLKEHSAKK